MTWRDSSVRAVNMLMSLTHTLCVGLKTSESDLERLKCPHCEYVDVTNTHSVCRSEDVRE